MECKKYKKRAWRWIYLYPCVFGVSLIASLYLLFGCKDKPHWSYKDCVEEIAERLHLTDYVYSVKELDDGYKHGDDEVYCFDITVRANGMDWQYYCYAVIDDGEVMYVDCDYKG